jgi:retron-type reverse transcriptase
MGAKKVHSLVDKVYKRKNLEMAWEKVKANRGSGGVDGQSLAGFAAQLEQQLNRLQSELKEDVYRPQPVRQVQIPKAGKPGEFRTLGIPTIYDRVLWSAKKFVRIGSSSSERYSQACDPGRSCSSWVIG